MKIVISAAASACDIDTEEPVVDAERLRKVDGLDYSNEKCAKYINVSLQDIGVVGGVIRLAFDESMKKLRVVTEYHAPRKLTATELKQLARETTAQWSDGIGEGEFRHRKKLKMDINLYPSKRGKVSAEQIDDGKKVRRPAVEPLMIAYRDRNEGEMRRLLADYDDPNAKLKGGTTPFLMACICQLFDLALEMIDKGADVRAVDKDGNTPLCCVAIAEARYGENPAAAKARLKSALPLAQTLIKKGAPVDGADQEGKTPLMWAANRRNIPLIELLIASGANVNAQDQRKEHRFTVLNHGLDLGIVKLLLAHGADPSIRNAYGLDAAEYAELNDHIRDCKKIVALLRSHQPKSG